MISKVTAANGIVAAASAAITGVVNDCTKSNKKEPIPNPIPPIQNPLIQFADLTTALPSRTIQIKNNKINANTFLTVITVTTSQSSNKYSAAGNPNAKILIATTRIAFDLMISESSFFETSE